MAVIEADGLLWEIEYGSHDEIGPWHEQELTPRVLSLLPDGGVFLDVGAHVGHYAIRAAARASMVYAVEPNPATAARLRDNIKLNGLANVHVIEVAAWDGTGQFTIARVHEQYERDGSNRVLPAAGGPVQGARLDEVLSRYPLRPDRIDLVKVDVEGADLHAISGMAGLIAKHQPVLFVEDHSEYGYYEQDALFELLDDVGYPGWEKVTWGNATYWLCRPDAAAPAASDTPALS